MVPTTSVTADSPDARAYRVALVKQLAFDIADTRVLSAMASVPRHLFMPGASLANAYADHAAKIGHGQTISQPTVVGIMTEALDLKGTERVLEIGTGSGYQAAILSLLCKEVFSVEVIDELAQSARARLERLGYDNVHVSTGDGYAGLPEHAPFDRILVTAAPETTPQVLIDQLGEHGVLVVPVGPTHWAQRLRRYRKQGGHVSREDLGAVQFVPMVTDDPTGELADGLWKVLRRSR
jgi:protein-L-isoaspartate(D-aspartate) O-methyltransferase